MKTNKYCDIQDGCKLLKQANAQYNEVVKQNRSLQTELIQERGRNIRLMIELIKLKAGTTIIDFLRTESNEK